MSAFDECYKGLKLGPRITPAVHKSSFDFSAGMLTASTGSTGLPTILSYGQDSGPLTLPGPKAMKNEGG